MRPSTLFLGTFALVLAGAVILSPIAGQSAMPGAVAPTDALPRLEPLPVTIGQITISRGAVSAD